MPGQHHLEDFICAGPWYDATPWAHDTVAMGLHNYYNSRAISLSRA